jgi:hypothetical protein
MAIIGAGPAGMSAAIHATRKKPVRRRHLGYRQLTINGMKHYGPFVLLRRPHSTPAKRTDISCDDLAAARIRAPRDEMHAHAAFLPAVRSVLIRDRAFLYTRGPCFARQNRQRNPRYTGERRSES